jgi:hypothetical protein
VRFAYLDPPYLGCCKLYDHEHGEAGLCWDDPSSHHKLMDWASEHYPDGWALSASSGSLRDILPASPEGTRVAAWVKPFCAFRRGVRPCYSWEPVLFWRGRNPPAGFPHKPPVKGGTQTTPKDYLAESITLRKGLTGAKPEAFCRWVLDLLNAQPGDYVRDLFPGTGIMSRVATEVTQQ